MAASLNKVFLIGNLTRDPEMRKTPAGDSVTEISIAVSEQFRSRSTNETREVVTFVDVSVWGASAENCVKFLTKGRPVMIEGRLVLDQWTDKESNQKRTRLRVRADRVQFLNPSAPRRETSGQVESQDWAPVRSQQTPHQDSVKPASMPAPAAEPVPADSGDDDDLPF